MTKCLINSHNEITGFWDDDETAPKNSLACDKSYPIHGGGEPDNQTFFYKLENGKVITTDAGKVYTAQEYARKREVEYPSIEELVVALYDTDDKSAIEAKRAEVKAKYPK